MIDPQILGFQRQHQRLHEAVASHGTLHTCFTCFTSRQQSFPTLLDMPSSTGLWDLLMSDKALGLEETWDISQKGT